MALRIALSASLLALSRAGVPPVIAQPAVPVAAKPFGSIAPKAAHSAATVQTMAHTPLGQQESFAAPNARASIVAKAGIGIAGEPADLATCPGSNREQCNKNDIHRVCVKLLTEDAPTIWGMDTSTPEGTVLDYWAIVGKNSFRSEWWKQMTDRKGDSRCIGTDSTATLIKKVGCDKVTIRCEASDLNFIFMNDVPRSEGIELQPFKACVKKQCNPGGVWDRIESAAEKVPEENIAVHPLTIMFVGCAAMIAAGVAMRRRTTIRQAEELLG